MNVNTTNDVINPNDNLCSLREAVIAANTNTASGGGPNECPAGTIVDTINLQAARYDLTIVGTGEDAAATGDLDILTRINFYGAGQDETLIYGNDLDRILDIHDSVNGLVVVRDLELSHGDTNGNGGAVQNKGELTMRRVTIFKHGATLGGAIWSDDTLILEDCVVDGNLSSDDGAGLYLTSGSQTTMTRCTVSDNEAGGTGGGILTKGVLELVQSVVELNEGAWGGGIHAENGNLTLTQSTIGKNNARRWGGGLANENNATITSSAISGNDAVEYGGNVANMAGGDMTLLNVTIANGTAPSGNAVHNAAVVRATNSIVKGGCAQNDLISNGGNLESPGNGCGFGQASDKRNVSIGGLYLFPLGNYGGPTPVNVVGLGSVARDGALNGPCPSVDQRGAPRPQDGDDNGSAVCENGSFEEAPILFPDGFESGNTTAWSSTVRP